MAVDVILNVGAFEDMPVTNWLGERIRALANAWRNDWEATRPVTRVIFAICAVLLVAWVIFALWFALMWRF